MARVIFMGTPEFAAPCLLTLIETQQVVGVVTQPDKPAGRGKRPRPAPVKQIAEAAGIPIYQPQSLKKEESAAPLRAWRPDVIIVAAFGQILRPHVLYLPPHGSINVHASLLPRWRGASPIQHAILAGDTVTGVTLMQMNEGLDTGAMYVCESLAIGPRETAAGLHDRLSALGAELLRLHLDDILAGRIAPMSQNDTDSTYAPMIRKEAGQIDWRQDAATLDRLVRAMTPWPGAYTWWKGEPLKILQARPTVGERPSGSPGQVTLGSEGLTVTAADGGLILEEVQMPGKRAMLASDFIHGHPDLIGSVLGKVVS